MARETEADRRSGRARLNVLYALQALKQIWDRRLIYPLSDYEALQRTTRNVCPAERSLVLSQSGIACSVRTRWLPRFRVMLAAGIPRRQVFEFYVDGVLLVRAEVTLSSAPGPDSPDATPDYLLRNGLYTPITLGDPTYSSAAPSTRP